MPVNAQSNQSQLARAAGDEPKARGGRRGRKSKRHGRRGGRY